ncbi:MAG: DUF433 domain-containing protein [Lentisphaerae bacterium]|nr:DUF433 domain-containing protein [Lentisphaerota bacterium]
MSVTVFVEIDPRRCGGKPVVSGTRIPVSVVLDQLADAGSIEGLISKYPELTVEKVAGVLRYCNAMIEHTDLEPVLT